MTTSARRIPIFIAPSTGLAHWCSIHRCSTNTRMSKRIYRISKTFSLSFPWLTLLCPNSLPVQAFRNEPCPAFEETGKKREGSCLYSSCLLSPWRKGKETILKGDLQNLFIKKNYDRLLNCILDQNVIKKNVQNHFRTRMKLRIDSV